MKSLLRLLLHVFLRIVAGVARPLRENGCFVIFMMAAWGITVWRQVQYQGEVWTHCFELLIDLYLMCVLFTLLPQRLARVVRALCYGLGYLLPLFEVFLTERFLMLYTPTSLRLFLETNAGEAGEFLTAYLSGDALWRTLLWYLPLIVANVWLVRSKWVRRGALPSSCAWVVNLLLTGVLVYSCFPWASEKAKFVKFYRQSTTQTAETVRWQTFYTPFFRLLYSYRMLQLADRDLVNLKNKMHHLQIDSVSYRCPTIVLILGESYNKYHSQLYGYSLPTTPHQLRLAVEDSLVVFTDVVSPWNLTSNVFKQLFSTHSLGEPGSWHDGVLFPSVFRKAGYRVAFLTNQYQNVNRQSSIDFNGSFFLNDPEMDSLCFDFRNRIIYRYDRAFIREYRKFRPSGHDLVIFHLYGQHQKYDYRFTEKDVYFTVDSLKKRRNLSRQKKQIVADYDNATRYNDDVVRRIYRYFVNDDAVVIYLADHGEEVFDQSLMFGRTPADPLIPLTAHYEFEVPMTMWFSPSFYQNHPDVVRAARRASSRPFMSDDLSHLLMGLAGISCPYYDVHRDLLHDSFRVSRPRLLKNKYDYDSLLHGTRFYRERIKAGHALDSLRAQFQSSNPSPTL